MTARGRSTANDAPDLAVPELGADPIGLHCRTGLNTVVNTSFAEISANGGCGQVAEQIGIGAPDTIPFLTGRFLAA